MLDEYVSELVRVLQARLGDRLVAVWQIGSGALGGWDPATSDVDVQAVSAPLSRPELEALAAELSAVPCPVRGLEFVLYADPPAFQLNLNTGPGMEHHEGYDPAAEPRFWFVLDLEIAREHAKPLVGPHPRELDRRAAGARRRCASRSRGGANTAGRRRTMAATPDDGPGWRPAAGCRSAKPRTG